jgi:L-fucose isomerase
MEAKLVTQEDRTEETALPKIGVFAACDPRIDDDSRKRSQNIVRNVADALAGSVNIGPDHTVPVLYSDLLVDAEAQADKVANQFKKEGVNILVCAPDTWSFPQLTAISLLSHFPKNTPINFTTGNSAPRPGVVFTHAAAGAISQYGGMVHINVGDWPDDGMDPKMSPQTEEALTDWCYAAATFQGLKGRRIVVFGHDSMGMETALPHVIETRNQFGIEITRLDMKLLADMLKKESYDTVELKKLKKWLFNHAKDRIELNGTEDEERLEQSLALYLIVRDMLSDLNAVGGGFMSQLEWGSDKRGIPLPVADIMESLFNSTFDHNGRKEVIPFATEADVQGILTQLFMTWLSGGNPPLFMDFRKVWEPDELENLAEEKGIAIDKDADWFQKGLVDGVNSGSASFNWAGPPDASAEELMEQISFPKAVDYFMYLGNSAHFISPAGIGGIAARLAYSSLSGMFSLVWDEAETVCPSPELAEAICETANPTWPHTFIRPKHATMNEYKQYAPANHFHMTRNLKASRLQYWMDLANVLSVAPWEQLKKYREGIDRPQPLLYLLNGGEKQTKMLRK